MSIQSFEDLLSINDLKVVEVETAEWWGSNVFVRQFDAEAMTIFSGMDRDTESALDVTGVAVICALCMCTDSGQLLVPRNKLDESVEAIKGRNFEAINTVAMAALKASGLTSDELEEAGNE